MAAHRDNERGQAADNELTVEHGLPEKRSCKACATYGREEPFVHDVHHLTPPER